MPIKRISVKLLAIDSIHTFRGDGALLKDCGPFRKNSWVQTVNEELLIVCCERTQYSSAISVVSMFSVNNHYVLCKGYLRKDFVEKALVLCCYSAELIQLEPHSFFFFYSHRAIRLFSIVKVL